MGHTILLIQAGSQPETRTYTDYDTLEQCLEGICKIYEQHLKLRNPSVAVLTYDVYQLFQFIDQLSDLSCLVYKKGLNCYAPYNKLWLKEQIYLRLKETANKGSQK